jgi:hypothetical protein
LQINRPQQTQTENLTHYVQLDCFQHTAQHQTRMLLPLQMLFLKSAVLLSACPAASLRLSETTHLQGLVSTPKPRFR